MLSNTGLSRVRPPLQAGENVTNGEAGYKVLPVSELQRVWDQSCPLRFINNWALDKNYVPQCYEKPVTIEAR